MQFRGYARPVQPSPAAIDCVRRWTRAALAPTGGFAAGPAHPNGLSDADLLAAVTRHRVVELLAAPDVELDLPVGVAGELARVRHRHRRAAAVQLLELSRVERLFREGGVPWLAIKGPTLAAATTGDFTARGAGDLDLFVAPDALDTAVRLLVRHGWSLAPGTPTDPSSWAWRHVRHTFNEMTLTGPQIKVDLHWRLDPTHAALPDFATAWSRRFTVPIDGVDYPTLGPADTFAHTCHHAARDNWRWLRSLVDVHRLAARHDWGSGELSRPETRALAVTDACIGLPAVVPAEIRARVGLVPTRVSRRAMEAQCAPAVVTNPFPAAQTLRDARYRLSVSRAPIDLRAAAASAVLPVNALDDLPATSARAALPRLLARRVAWLVRRLVSWPRARVAAGRPSSVAS